MSAITPELAIAVEVFRRLELLGIRCYVGGSAASSYYGEARSTRDVDFVADMNAPDERAVFAAFADDFYVSEEAMHAAVASGECFNLIHYAAVVKIDIFVVGNDAFSREALRHCRLVSVSPDPTMKLPIASPEDVVVKKLAWFRAGGEQLEQQ